MGSLPRRPFGLSCGGPCWGPFRRALQVFPWEDSVGPPGEFGRVLFFGGCVGPSCVGVLSGLLREGLGGSASWWAGPAPCREVRAGSPSSAVLPGLLAWVRAGLLVGRPAGSVSGAWRYSFSGVRAGFLSRGSGGVSSRGFGRVSFSGVWAGSSWGFRLPGLLLGGFAPGACCSWVWPVRNLLGRSVLCLPPGACPVSPVVGLLGASR